VLGVASTRHTALKFRISLLDRMINMSGFIAFVPSLLLRRAFAYGGEYAWTRADALETIAIAEHQGFSVLGVDVWVPSALGAPIIPAPILYCWSSQGWIRYPHVPRSPADFIRTFEWDPSDAAFLSCEPYFNLTIDDQRS